MSAAQVHLTTVRLEAATQKFCSREMFSFKPSAVAL